MDQVLVATSGKDLVEMKQFAQDFGLGLELQAFSEPAALGRGWKNVLQKHKQQLNGFNGLLGVHGAFYDMNSASPDPEILAITRRRYLQNLEAAAELGANYVVFHLNYLGLLKLNNYRAMWTQGQITFWESLIEVARKLDLVILLENTWEDDPHLILDIVKEFDQSNLKICLDIAHARLYSEVPIHEWTLKMKPYLHLCHLNNHDGKYDRHWPLPEGVIDYKPILSSLRTLRNPPFMCLELSSKQHARLSLPLLNLNHHQPT